MKILVLFRLQMITEFKVSNIEHYEKNLLKNSDYSYYQLLPRKSQHFNREKQMNADNSKIVQ